MKLLDLQKALKPIIKDSQNPHFKNTYFDINTLIETIKPIINDLGIVIIQPLAEVNGKLAIKTVLIDSVDSKVLAESVAVLPENNDPQKLGSAISYFRRYSLQSLLLLEAEDDDANLASKPSAVTATKVEVKAEGLPWLEEAQYQRMLQAIADGSVEVVKEKMNNYRMKTVYRTGLNSALNPKPITEAEKAGLEIKKTIADALEARETDEINIDEIPF